MDEKMKKPTDNFKLILEFIYNTFKGRSEEILKDSFLMIFDNPEIINYVLRILKENNYLSIEGEENFKECIKEGVKLHGAESREDFVSRAYELLMNA